MKLTKFERTRIIGARALQLAMGAPILIRKPKDVYSPTVLAEMELEKGVLPITIKRPNPKKVEFEQEE